MVRQLPGLFKVGELHQNDYDLIYRIDFKKIHIHILVDKKIHSEYLKRIR